MNLVRAQRYINLACFVSAAGIVAGGIIEKFIRPPFEHPLHLFSPWIFASESWLIAAVIAGLTYLLYRKHSAGPLFLLLIYCMERMWIFVWLYIFSTEVIVAWLSVSALWAFCLVQAVRATFAFEQARRDERDLRQSSSK